jgi:hypothetical protein
MNRRHRGPVFAAAFLAVASLAPQALALNSTEVDVVPDMTPEGRRVAPPAPGHPVYYLPLIEGIVEKGPQSAGEKISKDDVGRFVTGALTQLGYLVANPKPRANSKGEICYADGTVVTVPEHPSHKRRFVVNASGGIPLTVGMIKAADGPYSTQGALNYLTDNGKPPLARVLVYSDPVHGPVLGGLPTQIIVFHWGTANPSVIDDPTGGTPDQTLNADFMMALVAGHSLSNLNRGWISDELIIQGGSQDRYFVAVSSYDFAAFQKDGKKVLLWRTLMSVPSAGLENFDQVALTLVKAGGPFFGREASRPQLIDLPVTPAGHVVVGTPEVKDYRDAPPSQGQPAATPAQSPVRP